MADFWAMGGYAPYVWSAFGFSIAALVGLFIASWIGARKRAAELERWRRRVERAEQS
ncbi:MAG: heme exporter protein CcmD [Alphaproteobacteria bacterium]